MIVPTSPKAGYLAYKRQIDAAVAGVLDSGWYLLGDELRRFEVDFAHYIGVGHAVGVASGTDAIELALRACGVGAGDLVLTVSHTAVATVAAIERCGAVPGFVDIDPVTYNMDPNRLEAAIHKAGRPVKAVVPVHLYGLPADMKAIGSIAREHGIYVIEDCAQAHGAAIDGRRVGTFGHVGAFSFYPTKNLGALGDGGCVVSDDPALADRVRSLREYGWQQRHVSTVPGVNSRLDELQAAILGVKLKHLDDETGRRQEIAAAYDATLGALDMKLAMTPGGYMHVYHQYVIRTDQRDELKRYLSDHDIATLIHYPVPVHRQPAYAGRLLDIGSLEQTQQAADQILSLPMYPQLTNSQVAQVAERIVAWSRRSDVS